MVYQAHTGRFIPAKRMNRPLIYLSLSDFYHSQHGNRIRAAVGRQINRRAGSNRQYRARFSRKCNLGSGVHGCRSTALVDNYRTARYRIAVQPDLEGSFKRSAFGNRNAQRNHIYARPGECQFAAALNDA